MTKYYLKWIKIKLKVYIINVLKLLTKNNVILLELQILVKSTMEAIALDRIGHLPVKICVGKSWGSLEPVD